MDWVATMSQWDDELQAAIDSGEVWQTPEGAAYARRMIHTGAVTLGPVAVTAYTGERIPARGEIVPGSEGSEEYRDKVAAMVAAGNPPDWIK
jgi:hypothetical protein